MRPLRAQHCGAADRSQNPGESVGVGNDGFGHKITKSW